MGCQILGWLPKGLKLNDRIETDEIWVTTVSSSVRSDKGVRLASIKIEALAENVREFLEKIEKIMAETPDEMGKFQLTEFTVSAEISATGSLSVLGTGVETTGSGGLEFKFERKSLAGKAAG